MFADTEARLEYVDGRIDNIQSNSPGIPEFVFNMARTFYLSIATTEPDLGKIQSLLGEFQRNPEQIVDIRDPITTGEIEENIRLMRGRIKSFVEQDLLNLPDLVEVERVAQLMLRNKEGSLAIRRYLANNSQIIIDRLKK